MVPMKQSKIKNSTQEWFDEEVAEKINIREKCFKRFKNTKLHVAEEIFKETQKDTRNIIKRKKKEYFEIKLTESTKRLMENNKRSRARMQICFNPKYLLKRKQY